MGKAQRFTDAANSAAPDVAQVMFTPVAIHIVAGRFIGRLIGIETKPESFGLGPLGKLGRGEGVLWGTVGLEGVEASAAVSRFVGHRAELSDLGCHGFFCVCMYACEPVFETHQARARHLEL